APAAPPVQAARSGRSEGSAPAAGRGAMRRLRTTVTTRRREIPPGAVAPSPQLQRGRVQLKALEPCKWQPDRARPREVGGANELDRLEKGLEPQPARPSGEAPRREDVRRAGRVVADDRGRAHEDGAGVTD